MPATATPRKPHTLARKLVETRNTSRNRGLAAMLGLGESEKELARDFGSGLNDVIGRGTLASLIGLPGDLGGLAENGVRSALGMPQVQPYGGSEHIGKKLEEAGLVSPVRRPKTELLASLISPSQAASAAYRAPQMARAGVRMLDNLEAPSELSSEAGAIKRTLGIPEDAGELMSQYSYTGVLRNHPAYDAAKHGDEQAGYDLAKDLIGDRMVRKIDGLQADNPRLLPMYTPEAKGRNAIPNGMALYLNDRTGIPIELGVAQTNSAGHTGASAIDRMVSRAEFDGFVMPGADYIPLDDVVTMGGTIAEASNFVRNNGADVAGVMALTNKGKSSILTPDKATIDALRLKHGSLIEDELGIVPEALTRAEAEYLSMFGSPNSLRAKILAAKKTK